MKNLVTYSFTISLFLIFFLLLNSLQKTYALVTQPSGNTDTCNEVHITITENPSCPNPPPNNTTINSYSTTIALKSIDGKSHSIHYWDHNDFCLGGSVDPNCPDNPINDNNSLTVDAAGNVKKITLTRSPVSGSYCGTYQQDFGIGDIDGNKSCHYENNGGAGGSGKCDTGVDCSTTPNCTTGASNCTACTGAAPNTCSNNGTQTCTHDQTQTCNPVQFTRSCTIDNCSSGYTCSSGTCVKTSFDLSGLIFIDYNNNGNNDSEDDPYANQTVTVAATQTRGSNVGTTYQDTATGSQGMYHITVPSGTYTIKLTVPSGYIASTNNPITGVVVNGADSTGNNFGIAPTFTLSGVVYNDVDGDQFYTANDSKYSGSSTINISGGSINKSFNFTGGSYNSNTAIQLPPGTYSVSYTSLPSGSGYFMTYPQNGPPPTFTNLTVGTPGKSVACSVPTSSPGPYNSVSCDANGNIVNLNFGISNVKPWTQSICGDMRADGGMIDPVPASYTCGSTSSTGYAIKKSNTCLANPGIFFSGNSTSQFNPGQVSANNWIAGGGNTMYSEIFSPINSGIMRTSYNYLLATAKQSGITPTDLATVNGCNVSSSNGKQVYTCTFTSSLQHGLYIANGSLNLNSFTVPTSPSGSSYGYVILVNGDATINGSIIMPPSTNSTFTLSASGNIIIPPTTGQTSPSDTTTTIAGFYSADQSFIIQPGSGSCSTGRVDRRFNIAGSIVVNAGLQGGTFQNQRDLCIQDIHCPSIVFTQRPDLLLNAPPFIKHTSSLFQEVAP